MASAYRSVFSILQRGLGPVFPIQERIVPERVLEAWRDPCSFRCCGEIAAQVRSCRSWVDFGGVGLSTFFSILQRGLGPVFPIQDRIVPERVLEAWRDRWSFRCCGEIAAQVRSCRSWVDFGGVGLSTFFSILQRGLGPVFPLQERIVPERVLDAWRDPWSFRCCGEIAAQVRSCRSWVDFGGVGLSTFFLDFAERFGTGLPDTRAHRTRACA